MRLLLFLALANISYGNIQGKVFKDFPVNGSNLGKYGILEDNELGIKGVIVKAYDINNQEVAKTITSSDGNYTLDINTNGKYRIEFSNWAPYLKESQSEDTLNSSIRFASNGDSINFGLHNPNDYTSTTSPNLVTSVFLNGDPSLEDGPQNSLIQINYNDNGDGGSNVGLSHKSDMGTVWGLAYDKKNKLLYSSAILKRHAGLNENGINNPLGAIYKYNIETNTTTLFLDVSEFTDVGEVATNADRELSTYDSPSHDVDAFAKVGKVGLGDIDIDEDTQQLYVVSLKSKEILKIDISSKELLTKYSMNSSDLNNSCTNGNLRPFGLKYYEDNLYVGAVCDGENNGTVEDLKAYVFKLNDNNVSFDEILSFKLDYPKEPVSTGLPDCPHDWLPWSDIFQPKCRASTPNYVVYPQPILSDIEFDEQNNMILGFMDRAGLQYGYDNYGLSGTTLYRNITGGDILKAFYNKNSDSYTIENIKEEEEFFVGDLYSTDGINGHLEVSSGGLAILKGSNNILLTAMDPVSYNAGGVIRLSDTTGEKVNSYNIYHKTTSGLDGYFGKSGGIGDVELLTDPAPIEIGNRVWLDKDRDGVQDADEKGIEGVVLTLSQAEDCSNPIATTTTDSNGSYLFNHTNVDENSTTPGLAPNTKYTICIDESQFKDKKGVDGTPLAKTVLSPNDIDSNSDDPDKTDSDIKNSEDSGLAYITFTTKDAGENDHSYDIGIVETYCIGDRVWLDEDKDGIQDSNELNSSKSVTIELLDESGNSVKNANGEKIEAITTTNGAYKFCNLLSNRYKIKVTPPAGYVISSKDIGDNDNIDNDINSTSKESNIIELKKDNLTIDIGIYEELIISGNIFDDGNGDGIVNGTALSNPDETQLYVNLLDKDNKVIASKAVNSDGTYMFDDTDGVGANSNYTIVLSTSSNSQDATLPTNWNNDGEHIGTDKGVDDKSDGKIVVEIKDKNIENINFGINKQPVAKDISEKSQINPGGTTQVKVPDIKISDNEDGTPTTVIIKSLPSNAKIYYDGQEITEPKEIKEFDNSKLKVDPDNGELTVTFKYATKDKAGVESNEATVTMPFTDIILSGKLFDDGNGDGDINGKSISTVDGKKIFADLLDSNGKLVASEAIENGKYSFDTSRGVKPNSEYSIILTIVESGDKPELPTNWSNEDGENIGTTGNDGKADGEISVSVKESNIVDINFGINQKPKAEDVTEKSQPNPGGDKTVVVPNLKVTDNEDKTPTTIIITELPKNAKLYYDGKKVEENKAIDEFDANKLTVDPDDGDVTVTFKYTTKDKAGVESNKATVTMPFTDIIISGKLFDDGNGDNNINGKPISKVEDKNMYISILDSDGKLLSSKPLDNNGSYEFNTADGIGADSDYTLILSDTKDATTPKLPKDWNNADGENIGTNGNDGEANGKINISIKDKNIENINFGINKKPIAKDVTEKEQLNPSGDNQVKVPKLPISDKEDGTPSTVTITKLPSNALVYYDGSLVSEDEPIENFDADKLTIDPDDGNITAVFKYTTTDKAGVESDSAKVTMPFKMLIISGHVFNDGNNDGIVNGTAISAPNGTQLYVTLLDSNNEIVKSKSVNSDGTYSFDNSEGVEPNRDYTVVLTTQEDKKEPSLPINWSNLDGEHIGTDAGTDGDNNGKIKVPLKDISIVEVNFGINKKPVAGDKNTPEQLNPGGDTRVDVPDLNITDNEDGTPKKVTIESVPTNGVLYYDGKEVKAGQVIENLNNNLLTLDPVDGTQVVSFTYTTTDSAGVKSEVATVSMSFRELKISGNVFDDGNSDGTVNGDKISRVNQITLHAVLLDENNKIVKSTPIKSDGSYQLGVYPNTKYRVVLSINENNSSALLPQNWQNADGEHIGTNKGVDDKADGEIIVDVKKSDIENINFGINKQPLAKDVNGSKQLNPGGNIQIIVPDLIVSDKEDTTPTTITIKSLPQNGTLYYDGKVIKEPQTIENFDNSKLTLDPQDGSIVVTFDYTTTDKAGFESNIATVNIPLVGVGISGNVFDDGNGDGIVNGDKISQVEDTPLFVNLLDSNNQLISSYPLELTGDNIGEYNFGNIETDKKYRLIVTTSTNSTIPTLPRNWNNDGESIGSKLDNLADGIIEINVTDSNITDINFGINKRPITKNVASTLALNPNKNIQVVDLNATDKEDGKPPHIVTILTLPSNGTLYYDGTEVIKEQNITDFNNSKLMVQPNSGNTVIVFTYSATDNGGLTSEISRVRMPFYVPEPEVIDTTPVATPPIEREEQPEENTNTPEKNETATVAPAPAQEEQPAVIYNLDIADDEVEANKNDSTTVIPVLQNDNVNDGVKIRLVNIREGEILWNQGTAVGGTDISTTDTIVVEGEGVWRVENGNIIFTAEDGFTGVPTPIYYLVEDQKGNRSNIAEVAIKTNCACKNYDSKVSDSVSAFNIISMIFMLLITTLFARKEQDI